jgi:hypothetical protein
MSLTAIFSTAAFLGSIRLVRAVIGLRFNGIVLATPRFLIFHIVGDPRLPPKKNRICLVTLESRGAMASRSSDQGF